MTTHVVVTPARNEAENLQRLGRCIIEQTWRPKAWIVVDNGSTDATQGVVRAFGRDHPWIRLLSIEGESRPVRGRATVRAFNAGVSGQWEQADLITNLDADVSFESTYFDSLRDEFERESRLGIASGLCFEFGDDGWHPVHVTHPNLRGASRTYRRDCLAQLLPLEERFASEGIDVIRANVHGWSTATIPALRYFHHRPTGGRDRSRFSSFSEEGKVAYYMWYRPSYLLMRTFYRALWRRDLAASGLAWGYFRSALDRNPRHAEAGFREFVHSNQSFRNWLRRLGEAQGKH